MTGFFPTRLASPTAGKAWASKYFKHVANCARGGTTLKLPGAFRDLAPARRWVGMLASWSAYSLGNEWRTWESMKMRSIAVSLISSTLHTDTTIAKDGRHLYILTRC